VDLTKEENNLIKLFDHSERHIDQLCQLAGLPSNRVSAILLTLEIKGLVKQLPGKVFARI
jgi:DNA processing protein